MQNNEHMLERRSRLLANRITRNVEIIRDAIAPPNTRPPFTEQLSKADALAWWSKNRHTKYGQQILSKMQPSDIMDLDLALNQYSPESE